MIISKRFLGVARVAARDMSHCLVAALFAAGCSASVSALTSNDAGPDANPQSADAVPEPTPSSNAPYVTFPINIHDITHVDESAATVTRAIGIFQKYGVRGDFYITGPMTQLYAEKYPAVISLLRDSGMTISYHVRPPHPLYQGFDTELKALDNTALAKELLNYETYALDLTTGKYIPEKPGGYSFAKTTFGRAPVVVSTMSDDPRIKSVALKMFASLGAKMTLEYHETGTDPVTPLVYTVEGLVVRPSDFSITEWSDPAKTGSRQQFWWNKIYDPSTRDAFNPTTKLKEEVAAWVYPRAPFVTSIIHENNFVRNGPEVWAYIYYTSTTKETPRAPPYDLNTPAPGSVVRSAAEQDAIWAAYEELVAYASKHCRVVTSEEIVQLAAATKSGGK